jgi:peptidoglycan hydrolase-like protein with peptidoglycan-binding domain
MGKCPAAWLTIALSLLLLHDVLADEQVLRVQEELRKRHLFYGNANGEYTPALSAAIIRYQRTKGFAPTGILDSETCASLGVLPHIGPQIAPAPFFGTRRGEVRGGNGELLPASTALFVESPKPSSIVAVETGRDELLALSESSEEEVQPPPERGVKPHRVRHHQARVRKEENPLVLVYQSLGHAMSRLFGDNQTTKKRRVRSRL